MRKLGFIVFVVVFASVAAQAQTQCPQGLICLSQQAANVAAANARELVATKEEVTVLKGAIVDLKQQIANTAATAAKNEADLKAENTKLLVQIADKSGALGECRADKLMYAPLIEYLTKNQRAKKIGIINL